MFRSTSLREKLTWLLTVHPYCDHNIQSKVHLTYFGHVLLLSCLILHQSVKSLTLKMLNFLIWRSLQLTSESLSPLSSTVAQNATLRRSLYGNLKIVREMKEIDSGTWKVEVLKIEALRMNEWIRVCESGPPLKDSKNVYSMHRSVAVLSFLHTHPIFLWNIG